jgi:molybdopterin/thiamine biosynthesis adenylyltransferase
MINFEDFFKRQIELWGIEKQKLLGEKSIAIIGSGGLGNSISLALGSVGLKRIYIIDFDEVSVSNIHRQLIFTQNDEKKYKSEVVANFLSEKSNFTEVVPLVMGFEEFSTYFEEKNIKIDLILDATDNLEVRKKIDDFSKKVKIPWIYGSVEAFHGQICFFQSSSFDVFNISDKKPEGISAPMVMQIASIQANLALKYLLGEAIKTDFLYYISFDKSGVFTSSGFQLPT